VLVDEILVALVGFAQRGAQQATGNAGEAAARAVEHLHGRIAQELFGGAGALEALTDELSEGVTVGPRLEVDLGGDAHGEWRVLLHAERAAQPWQADEPQGEQVTAVEGEVEKAGQVSEKGVGEVLCLVENEHGRATLLIDEVHEGLLEVVPQLAAAMARPDAEIGGEATIQIERADGGVALVEHEVVGPR